MTSVAIQFPLATCREKRVLRLVLVDDHPLLLESLSQLLALEPDFVVVGVAGNALDGIELARRLAPDIVITDISLGVHDGIFLISELRKLAPATKVLALTASNNRQHITSALLAGARGYILKDVCRADLVVAIRAIDSNYYLLQGPVSESFIADYLARDHDHKSVGPLSLTVREREIIALIAQGGSSRHIANQLKLSAKTIAKHRANLMRKANLHSTAAITTFAMWHRLDSPSLDSVSLQ